jgi:hypothetical protein
MIPWLDFYYSLGDPTHRFLNVWAKNIYGDPVGTIDYLNSIYNELQQIQSTVQNINVLINSHLTRELYETYSYMIQFDYPSGIIKLFSPKLQYQTIIRGWYAVSTGTSGLGQIVGSYSLTPVGLIPFSIPYLSFPDMFLRLYYDEHLLLYYNNVSLGTYLQLILNIIQQWTGVTLRASELYPSGIDPVRYMPQSGWQVFFDFLSQSEVETPEWWTNYTSIFQVTNGILTMRGTTGYNSYVMYGKDSLGPSRVVTTFRIRNVTGNLNQSIVYYDIANGSKRVLLGLINFTLNPDETITTNLYDGASGDILVSNITLRQNTWYVLMYDFNSNTFSLLDTYGNVIASGKPTQISLSQIWTYISFGLKDGVHTMDVDWIGMG